MHQVPCKVTYRALAYYRLSKEDKGKTVSDSIENQRMLIQEYVSKHDEIELVGEFYDDGYSGTNYRRPGFQDLLEKVEQGEIDCVIVKDLSRLGREYIETGRFIEERFPAMGIRFIAVTDDYDSNAPKQSDDILIPVKNLMNETYCRDLSNKLRRQFMVQRSNGECLAAFASYGYRKSPEDKHKLIIDEIAAEVVRGIFYSKLAGFTHQDIADMLNAQGIMSPADYKKECGLKYKTSFSTVEPGRWTHVSVLRILKNRIYIGELIQGVRGKPNFKVKEVKTRRKEEWVVVTDNHEPIIDKKLFDIVQRMLQRDTRKPSVHEKLAPLAGMVFCPDCGRSVRVRTVTRYGRKFFYYTCSTYKNGRGCTSHSIEKSKLEEIVYNAIMVQINTVVDINSILETIKNCDLRVARMKKLKAQISQKELELEKYKEFKNRLLEALKDQLIERDEYIQMRDKYRAQEEDCLAVIKVLQDKAIELESETNLDSSWVEQYAKFQTIPSLTREMVVSLIDKILVHDSHNVEIVFNYRDEIAYIKELISESKKEVS